MPLFFHFIIALSSLGSCKTTLRVYFFMTHTYTKNIGGCMDAYKEMIIRLKDMMQEAWFIGIWVTHQCLSLWKWNFSLKVQIEGHKCIQCEPWWCRSVQKWSFHIFKERLQGKYNTEKAAFRPELQMCVWYTAHTHIRKQHYQARH